jgi:hypothetical protein
MACSFRPFTILPQCFYQGFPPFGSHRGANNIDGTKVASTEKRQHDEKVMFDKHIAFEQTSDDFLCRESTRNLFDQPDVLAIYDYLHVYRSTNAHTPEIGLIAAVLEDAIDCYLKYCCAKRRAGKRIFREAAEWIFDCKDDWIFGFESICEMLKLDPGYIRRVLQQRAEERLNRSSELSQDFSGGALRLAS